MADYKAEITLNERDSMQDMLNLEKQTVKTYTTAITEGTSKGFREQVQKNLNGAIDDQFNTFLMMCEYGHARVESEKGEIIDAEREKFSKIQKELN